MQVISFQSASVLHAGLPLNFIFKTFGGDEKSLMALTQVSLPLSLFTEEGIIKMVAQAGHTHYFLDELRKGNQKMYDYICGGGSPFPVKLTGTGLEIRWPYFTLEEGLLKLDDMNPDGNNKILIHFPKYEGNEIQVGSREGATLLFKDDHNILFTLSKGGVFYTRDNSGTYTYYMKGNKLKCVYQGYERTISTELESSALLQQHQCLARALAGIFG